mmetsp:Transcript_29347/g.52540  ORF Transcript_29347/g.52540 Transcript_29347/m.52540 type:complete len:201 (+) Transcript_29347:413-1015(+)|eukprot:CAMPEP_0204914162 /NCGR_PEP_ID=MMETSP1397-20131031/12005_1 /ASSEMBLY_ACC=CAM_ASM_000891 /TAXON_ID=49980 /ORGANISM="Climacostomum Climacostomum virens, Strain Stock W-24" /LENGTH=200 /DNA_ID=CAMNT_0052085597 /DNA_START=357 /DNA_END=959 /DNA_ORIENTATION=+
MSASPRSTLKSSIVKAKGFGCAVKFRLLIPEKPSLLVKPNSIFRSSSMIKPFNESKADTARTSPPKKVVYAKRGKGSFESQTSVSSRAESTRRIVKLKVFRTLSTGEVIHMKTSDSVKFPARASAKILHSRGPTRQMRVRNSEFALSASGLKPDYTRIELQPIYHYKNRRRLKVDMSNLNFKTVGTETDETPTLLCDIDI